MPTATSKPATNPLLDRIKADGIFSGGGAFGGGHPFDPNMGPTPGPDIGQQNAMANAKMYMPGTFGASNAVANGTGSVFGGGMDSPSSAPAPAMTPAAPTGAFSGGLPPPGMVGVNPVHAYAPTGLDKRAMATPGQGVWGQGDVMASFNGRNAQGGNSFSLGQVTPVGGPLGGPVMPASPLAPENLQQAGYRPMNPLPGNAKLSPNAGLIAAYGPDSTVGKYISAQDAAKLPVDMEHLKLLSNHQISQEKIDATRNASTEKAASNATIGGSYKPIDMTAISKNPANLDDETGTITDSLAHAQVRKLSQQLDTISGTKSPDPKLLASTQDKLFKAQEDAQAQDALANNKASALRVLDSIIPAINSSTVGWSAMLNKLPESQQRDFNANLEQLKSIFSVEGLKTVKNVRNVREFDAIAKAVANPDSLQSPANMKRVMGQARDLLIGEVGKDTYSKLQKQWGGGGRANAGSPPDGVEPAVWSIMTPEEKALFK